MISVFLAIAAALIAAVVLSSKNRPERAEDELIFCSDATCENEGEAQYDMLIGALSSLPQLSVCLEHNFYHIPAKLVPTDIDKIGYVAIYQSRRFFGEDGAGVRYFAKVKGAQVLPRYKIAEFPKNSHELYVRFDLEPWQKRIKAITPTAKGIVAGYTRFELFELAEELPQLWLSDKSEVALYMALKGAVVDKASSWGDVEITKRGKSLFLSKEGKIVAVISQKAFEKAPVKAVRYIKKQTAPKGE